MRYIIDSNIFIQSKNFEYRFQYCYIFWDFIKELGKRNIVFSINKVNKELHAKTDELSSWIDKELLPVCNNFFEDEFDSIGEYAKVINWADTQNYTDRAKIDFSNGIKADAFIIAHAIYTQSTIITAEVRNDNSKKRVIIPSVANHFGIKCVTLFEFLQNFSSHNFSVK